MNVTSKYSRSPDSADPVGTKPELSVKTFPTTVEDLDIDFDDRRPNLVTRLLAGCVDVGRTVSMDFYWGLEVGRRIEWLLIIAERASPGGIRLPLECPECGEKLEWAVDVVELSRLNRKSGGDSVVTILHGEKTVSFRKPTGNDQHLWCGRKFESPEEAERQIARTLALDEGVNLSAGLLARLNEEMEIRDPLVHFVFATSCVTCGTEGNYEIDLQEIALDYMRRAQHELANVVHVIASHYNWSEADILAIPGRRRQRYIRLIREGKN